MFHHRASSPASTAGHSVKLLILLTSRRQQHSITVSIIRNLQGQQKMTFLQYLLVLVLFYPWSVASWITPRHSPTYSSSLYRKSSKTILSETPSDTNTVPFLSFDFPQHQSLPESSYTQVIEASHIPISIELRKYYDEVYKDPRQAPNTNRPLLDPWFVYCREGKHGQVAPLPGDNDTDIILSGEREAAGSQIQYSLKRALCQSFFTASLYDSLLQELTTLASSIGLTSITPPWLSMYTDGDLQNFHTDAPHGPMAFVVSLCTYDFHGGETLLLQPKILDYFRGFDASKGLETPSIVRFIPPRPLGRCIAFDPRVPHGVNRVYGTLQDPRKARVVIHGWFMNPSVCWLGPWDEAEDTLLVGGKKNLSKDDILENALTPLTELLGTGDIGRVTGYLAVRMDIEDDGSVSHIRATCDTVVADMDDFRGIIGYDEADRPVMEDAPADVRLNIFEALKSIQFEPGNPGRLCIVPFSFE